ncbi:MAG: hypothetical protein ACRDHJ_01865, partial [Actinomycetota bacterium]
PPLAPTVASVAWGTCFSNHGMLPSLPEAMGPAEAEATEKGVAMDGKAPELSGRAIGDALNEIAGFLTNDAVVAAIQRATAEDDVWGRIASLPRDYLLRRDVVIPDRLELTLQREGGRWPGRRCFKVCRSVDPVPPPPDPTGIKICVELCLPG